MNASSAAPQRSATPFPMKRKIAAILAADVAGYSRMVAENEERTLTELAAARQIFDALVSGSGGRIFNTAGDSVMVEFDSAVEAVRAAVDIQEAIRSRNLTLEKARRLEFRMGLTIGDVVERDGDLLGDGVNIAARLEGLAPPGGICVSRSVHEAVANKLSVAFRELGPRQVKNIPQPVHAYLIASGPTPDLVAAEPLVARRSDASRREREGDGESRGIMRGLTIGAALLIVVFLCLPAFRFAQSWLDGRAPVASQDTKPPANEASTGAAVVPSGQTPPTAPTPPEKPAAVPPSQATTRPVKVERKAQPPKTEAPKTEALRTEAPRTETARTEPPKAEVPSRPPVERPADPAAAYASMARDGLIADARSLPELYHNARFLEAKGDKAGALAAYTAAAPLAGEYLDVHFRHASLLRALKGPAAVRQVFSGLMRTSPSIAAELVLALSAEPDSPRAKLEAFAEAHPEVAVADTLLADALLDPRDGGPTLTDRRLAFDATERFLDAAGSGELNARFVDRAFLDAWLDAARRRRGDVERFFASGKTRPTAAFSRTPSGWLARLTLPEPAASAVVRVGERGEPIATGGQDGRGGAKAFSVLDVELPALTGRNTLYVTYQDKAGREAGPFPLAFDAGSAAVDAGRSALERFPESWVSFPEDMPGVLSFAGLVSNRCAITRAAIGLGDAPPRQALPIPPCDAAGSAAMPSRSALVPLPDGTDEVRVQLTFADGTESAVRTFRRP